MSNHEQRLTIAQVITRMDTVGGAQIHVRDIATSLQRQGHVVHLITGEQENVHSGLESVPIHSVRHLVRDLRPYSDIRAYVDLKRLLKKIAPDIVATHSSKAGIIGRLAAWSLRIPVVFTAHGWSFTEGVPNLQKRFYRWIEKITGSFSSGVIAVSEYDQKLALKHKVISNRKLVCIQNGVPDVDKPQMMRQPNEEIRLIMIARFAPPKMQLRLVEALSDLKTLPWIMHFVGDGPMKEVVENCAINKGISDRVLFEGWHSNVEQLLATSDVFILLSEFEGLPLSILEAMRAGLPIIATDVGGVREAVTAENGFLVHKEDFVTLKEAIQQLVEDEELRSKMGAKGRELYEKKFTFDNMMDKTLAYYKSIAGKDERK